MAAVNVVMEIETVAAKAAVVAAQRARSLGGGGSGRGR